MDLGAKLALCLCRFAVDCGCGEDPVCFEHHYVAVRNALAGRGQGGDSLAGSLCGKNFARDIAGSQRRSQQQGEGSQQAEDR